MNFFKRMCLGIALLFKKSSQGVAASTGLAITPNNLSPDVEQVFVKKEEDNYHKETLNKSFRQMQYDAIVKRDGIIENPYLEWERLMEKRNPLPAVNTDWTIPVSPEELKGYLQELRMTEEQFIKFRKEIEAKTKNKS